MLRHRYQTIVPADVRKLLNRKTVSAELRQPSSLVQYLIFSNIATFVYYYRLWDCSLTIENDLSSSLQGMPAEEASNVCSALLTQLLSTESQMKVKQDSMPSAYMLDHLYYLSLFKDFRGVQSGQVMLDNSKMNKI